MSASLFRPLPRPRADRTLVCLSFCGGGTSAFRPWAEVLPEDVELVLYCYPGREGRFTTPFAADWEALMADALSAVRSVSHRPYVLLGHSMGAWVAFDLARRLECGAGRPPSGLVVSAADAPTRPAERRGASPGLRNTDAEILTWMSRVGQASAEVLAEPEMRQIAVDVFRADLRVVDSYRHQPGAVAAPLQVLYGEDDSVDARAAERWRPLASGPFETERLPGGHFYTAGEWARLPERLTALRTARCV
ncbi:alpha/beta fold hydrolase [Streptomyces sp. BG9H]|uniref:Alpha/beta fold hydrolase n=1 Tax=Streptomyces anatolicus TaxID=2675858 RepID=A0ABS6YGW5_9ACTN|nr:alpha/beta fold hydrolase [Streptomyces anatolicus]MBW5420640.1 alpha/beta fold hydrolase [Streptomyces anatolicus]